jgi:transglutaminase-like putative cysteine protease
MTRLGPTTARDLVQLAASLLGAVAVARLFADAGSSRVLWPLLACGAVGWAVPAGCQRLRLPSAVAVVAGTLVVVVIAYWTAIPGILGLPSGHRLHLVGAALRSARPELRAFDVPLVPLAGVILLAAMIVGLVALFQRLALGSGRSPRGASLASLVGTLALVAWSVTARPARGDVLLVLGFGALVLVALGAADTAGTGAAPYNRVGRAAVAGVALAVAAAVVLLPLPPSPPAAGGSTVAPTGLALTSRLIDLEVHDPDVVVFTARSTVPTYWQVAALSQLRNGVFVAGPDVADALSGRSTAGAATPQTPVGGSRAFSASVSVGHLSSRLLPVPPDTLAVRARPPAVMTASAVVTTRPTTPGTTYSVLATTQPPASVLAAADTTGGTHPSGQLADDLALPPQSPAIEALALQITSEGNTALGKAEALEDYFRSGRFAYTLDAPAVRPGSDPLLAFLTSTRRGNCEQFAGAFAVLARSVGLPARVAVGFTAGTLSHGRTVVRGRDAHAWPEVYLGSPVGWVSFEPTPGQLSGEQSPRGILGPVPLVGRQPVVTPTTPTSAATPTTSPPVSATTPTTAAATTTPTTSTSAPTTSSPSGGTSDRAPVVVALVVSAALIASASAVWWLWRVRRRRRPPAQRVQAAWRSVERSLARAGVPRPAGRSPARHVAHLESVMVPKTARLGIDDQLVAVLDEAGALARLVERSAYSPDPVTDAEADDAEQIASRAAGALRSPALRERLGRLVSAAGADQTETADTASRAW